MSHAVLSIVTVASASELPSIYSNHVAVERTMRGPFSVEGRSNRSGLRQPCYPCFASLPEAVGAARRWAMQEGIPAVHVFTFQ